MREIEALQVNYFKLLLYEAVEVKTNPEDRYLSYNKEIVF